MLHYHIRWSNSMVDWEAFPTWQEAQAQAEQLVKRGESYVIEQLDGDCQRCSSLPDPAKSVFISRDPRLPPDRAQPNADAPRKSPPASVSESESQVTRVLQSSLETRMRSIREKLSLTFTVCSTVEIEIRYGSSDRAKALLHSLLSTMEALTNHINNPAHVSGKHSREFREQLVQLRKRLFLLESRIGQRRFSSAG